MKPSNRKSKPTGKRTTESLTEIDYAKDGKPSPASSDALTGERLDAPPAPTPEPNWPLVPMAKESPVNADLLACCKELVELYEAVERKLVNRFIPVSIIVPEKFAGATFRAKAAIAAAEKLKARQ